MKLTLFSCPPLVVHLRPATEEHWNFFYIINFNYCGEEDVMTDNLETFLEVACQLQLQGMAKQNNIKPVGDCHRRIRKQNINKSQKRVDLNRTLMENKDQKGKINDVDRKYKLSVEVQAVWKD